MISSIIIPRIKVLRCNVRNASATIRLQALPEISKQKEPVV
jgi:hypothetical protein